MPLALQEILSALTQSKIELNINQNRSTMIRVLERKKKYTRLSIHHMFLEAPNEVIEALVMLLKNKRDKTSTKLIHQYIEHNSSKYDEKKSLNPNKLITQGKTYNLSHLYQRVNEQYFFSKLNLYITWFGTQNKIPRRQMTFGLYDHPQKLIKINRLLDTIETPQYFIEYIIYHEMLHEVYRPIVKANQRRSIHTKQFREKEKLFLQYDAAKVFETQFKNAIFK